MDGSDGRPEADPDGDGLANVLEYAFGLDPGLSSVGGGGDPASENAPVLVEGQGGEVWLEFGLVEGQDVVVVGEVSPDGANWVDSTPEALGGGRYGVKLPEGWGDGFVRVRATL